MLELHRGNLFNYSAELASVDILICETVHFLTRTRLNVDALSLLAVLS